MAAINQTLVGAMGGQNVSLASADYSGAPEAGDMSRNYPRGVANGDDVARDIAVKIVGAPAGWDVFIIHSAPPGLIYSFTGIDVIYQAGEAEGTTATLVDVYL